MKHNHPKLVAMKAKLKALNARLDGMIFVDEYPRAMDHVLAMRDNLGLKLAALGAA
jgi:hypothetical protein